MMFARQTMHEYGSVLSLLTAVCKTALPPLLAQVLSVMFALLSMSDAVSCYLYDPSQHTLSAIA